MGETKKRRTHKRPRGMCQKKGKKRPGLFLGKLRRAFMRRGVGRRRFLIPRKALDASFLSSDTSLVGVCVSFFFLFLPRTLPLDPPSTPFRAARAIQKAAQRR